MSRSAQPTLVIVSGYFSPLHIGHLDMIEGGAGLGDELLVIVNNNAQQLLKKGRVVIDEADRLRVVAALRAVDHAMLAVDEDGTVAASLTAVAEKFPSHQLVFANGGDRSGDPNPVEAAVCEKYGVTLVYGTGGATKADSSSRLIEELGL